MIYDSNIFATCIVVLCKKIQSIHSKLQYIKDAILHSDLLSTRHNNNTLKRHQISRLICKEDCKTMRKTMLSFSFNQWTITMLIHFFVKICKLIASGSKQYFMVFNLLNKSFRNHSIYSELVRRYSFWSTLFRNFYLVL